MTIPDNYKKYVAAVAVVVIAFSAGRFSAPAKVETREVEKVVYQQSESSNKNQNVVETEKETRLPDGTIITEKRKEKETSTQTEKEAIASKEKESYKSIEIRPSYHVGAIYEPAIASLQQDSYTVMLEKRLFSEIYLGVSYRSGNTFGLAISIGF